MSERRFAIVETIPFNPWTEIYMKDTITESELKRRLTIFTDEFYLEHEGYDKIIDILLHGEKGGDPRPSAAGA